MRNNWFHHLFGFAERDPATVYRNLHCAEGWLHSTVNGRRYAHGRLTTPSLAELRAAVPLAGDGKLEVSELVADVMDVHRDPVSAGALFQAASQFNLLEMVSPAVPPAAGVSGYEDDHTQGPACAIACGAGTVHRNYFVPLAGGRGQVSGTQLDCLADLGRALNNEERHLWEMRNGYCLANEAGLRYIAGRIAREDLTGLLRIGVHADTQVTVAEGGHLVTQAYCSALPVAYSPVGASAWAPFARLVLNATYEATLLAGLANFRRTGNPHVYLTLVGGGAFGNDERWIYEAVTAALAKFGREPLRVVFVSYGRSSSVVRDITEVG